MFFSAKQLYAAAEQVSWIHANIVDCTGKNLSMRSVRDYVRKCKEAIVNRRCDVRISEFGYEDLYKWYRPWDIVPELKNFQAPAGDYGIGVEVEYGFRSQAAATTIANKVKNWRNIALDVEGGTFPIEATFPPFLYSKMNSKRQVFRYLKLLRNNASLLSEHAAGAMVGTHVNVSVGQRRIDSDRIDSMREVMSTLWFRNTRTRANELANKYFGRVPYGRVNGVGSWQGPGHGSYSYVEYKLFNSTTDSKALRRYINIAVALTDLLVDETRNITEQTLLDACEAGYNKR